MSEPGDIPPVAPASALDKRKRRMTARWQYTNRVNARASTGPSTAGGKARVAHNARRHGLSLPALRDPGFAPEVVQLAHLIAQSVVGRSLDGERHELACRVAETMIDMRRIRLAKLPLVAAMEADMTNCDKPLAQLLRLHRYERRTLARRKNAIREFYEAIAGCPMPKLPSRWRWRAVRPNKAMEGKVKDSNEAVRW